jgi:LPS export ABC transporter protein LptC
MLKLNNIRRFLAFFIVMAVVSVTAAIALKVHRGKIPAETLPKLPGSIDVAMQKIHYTETRNGIKKWDLLGDQATYDKEREVVHLTRVRLLVAAGGKMGDITLTADRADYDSRSKDVKLVGNVEAKSASGLKFTTTSVTYLSGRSMIKTDDRVKLSDRRLAVDGVGMELMTVTKDLKIMKDVTASVTRGAGK